LLIGRETHRAGDLVPLRAILFEEEDVTPGRSAEVSGVVVGISRPGETVVGHLIPFFAGDFAGFATDANTRVGEEADFNVVLHVRMPPLVRALDSFADHRLSVFPCWP
jgi:hypothetical protein